MSWTRPRGTPERVTGQAVPATHAAVSDAEENGVDSRRWWLLAAAVPVALGCALATARPELTLAGQLAVIGAGVLAAVVLWRSGARTARPRAWRLLSVAPLLPVSGVVLTLITATSTPSPSRCSAGRRPCPATSWRSSAILTLVDRRRLRAGPRIAVEVALFLVACLVVVGLLVVGPAGSWSAFDLVEQWSWVGRLRHLRHHGRCADPADRHRARSPAMAARPAGRTVLLTLGRGLATSALLAGTPPVPAGLARCLMAAGLLVMALAALLDSQPAGGPGPRAATRRRRLSALLPQLALLTAAVTVGAVALGGARPSAGAVAGMVLCVVLTVVQRC